MQKDKLCFWKHLLLQCPLSAYLKEEIELRMQERTHSTYWCLGSKQLNRWDVSAKEGKAQEAAHRQRIAEEEALAAGFKSVDAGFC